MHIDPPDHSKLLLIIKTGNTYPHIYEDHRDFEHWIAKQGLFNENAIKTISVHENQALPEDLDTYFATIITGSAAMVTDAAPWMIQTSAWLKDYVIPALPTLGICFGHQLLALAIGGTVDYHLKGREIGTVDITKNQIGNDDPLFKGIENHFKAHVTHMQSICTLPKQDTHLLAYNAFEAHHAFRYGECCWGLQFHPEFDADIMTAYIDQLSDKLVNENICPIELKKSICHTPIAARILQNFINYAQNKMTKEER